MLNKQSNETNNSQNSSNYQGASNICFSDLDRLAKAVNCSTYSLNLELIIDTLNIIFLEMYERPLITVEALLLESIWENKTYSEVARENNYSSNYFSNVAAPKLLKKLSNLVDCRITKKNCRFKVTEYVLENTPTGLKSYGWEKKQDLERLNTMSGNYYSFGQKFLTEIDFWETQFYLLGLRTESK